MYFILNQYRLYGYLGQEVRHLLDIIVRHADRPDFSGFDSPFHRLVCLHVVRSGMMEQHQVHVTDVEFAQGFFDGFFGIGKLVRVELRANEQFLTRHAAGADGFADFFFVTVETRRVEFPVTEFDGG